MYLCVEDIGFNSFYVFGICVLKISVLPLSMYLCVEDIVLPLSMCLCVEDIGFTFFYVFVR
jgi:hypothetical protein